MSYDVGRQEDLLELTSRLHHAVGSERQAIERAITSICNENGLIRSMRERLIKESRAGNTENVRDISEFIRGKDRYAEYA